MPNLSQTKIEFLKYLILGGILTLLEWLGFYALYAMLGVNYIVASVIMFILISLLGLWLYKKAIFGESHLQLKAEILAIYAINIIGIILNSVILWLCVEFMGLNPMLGKIVASFLVAFYSFWARKKWIYTNKKDKNVESKR